MMVLFPWETQVQGKYQSAPFGKNTAAGTLLAGQTLLATVYGVDSFYNTDTTDSPDKIWASLSSDTYAVIPASQTLVSGATIFSLVPVTAISQVVTSTSAMANPSYVTGAFTVNPDTATALLLSGCSSCSREKRRLRTAALRNYKRRKIRIPYRPICGSDEHRRRASGGPLL